MATGRGWISSLRDRNAERWRAGEIDDKTFERDQAAWARKIMFGVFGVLLVVCAVGLSIDRLNRGLEIDIASLGLVLGFIAFIGLVTAYRVGQFAHASARNMVLKRNRDRVVANPAQDLTGAGPLRPSDRAGPKATRFYGAYKRSKTYGYFVLTLGAIASTISTMMGLYFGIGGQLVMVGSASLGVVLWGIFLLLDRRDYLKISSEGIWCRGWGTQQHAFAEFKAVYPRRNATMQGIVFVPRNLEQFRRRLPWYGRIALRGGGGVQAHVGTMTLWTTRVGVAQAPLLRALQAEIVSAGSGS